MSSVLGSIFGFGDKLKRRLKDAVSNPSDYAGMTADENRNGWRKNPDERSMGFFNPVPMGTMGNFVLRKGLQDAVEGGTDMSRREFMKKSAGLAGGTAAASIPGSKLLQKFAPEERAVAKQAAVETAPKYKYNSLKEYLDDAQMWAKEDFKAADLSGQGARYSRDEFLKRRLLDDEETYNAIKGMPEDSSPVGVRWEDIQREQNALSPQAKKEMKDYKNRTQSFFGGKEWSDPDLLRGYLQDMKNYGDPQW